MNSATPSNYLLVSEGNFLYGAAHGGYSGYVPPSYVTRMERLATFADAGSLAQLRADGVRYVIVHEGSYLRAAGVVATLEREGLKPMARLHDGWAAATVFQLTAP